jgi:hypothetical protein
MRIGCPLGRFEAAAGLYRRLRDQGNRVLNDPARLLSRYGLLRRLQRDGFNRFNAYRAEECVAPSRWPVFLRTEGNHGGALTGLLADQNALDGAVREAIARGYPISNLLIVEYVGEEVRPGLFRKMSVFKVGDRLLGYWCVHQSDWQVKQGTHGIATPELYEEEFQLVANDGYADVMAPVFDKAGVDYGRIDFSLLNGARRSSRSTRTPTSTFPITITRPHAGWNPAASSRTNISLPCSISTTLPTHCAARRSP